MLIRVHWNPYLERWIVTTEKHDKYLDEYPDCMGLGALVELDKTKVYIIRVTAEIVRTE